MSSFMWFGLLPYGVCRKNYLEHVWERISAGAQLAGTATGTGWETGSGEPSRPTNSSTRTPSSNHISVNSACWSWPLCASCMVVAPLDFHNLLSSHHCTTAASSCHIHGGGDVWHRLHPSPLSSNHIGINSACWLWPLCASCMVVGPPTSTTSSAPITVRRRRVHAVFTVVATFGIGYTPPPSLMDRFSEFDYLPLHLRPSCCVMTASSPCRKPGSYGLSLGVHVFGWRCWRSLCLLGREAPSHVVLVYRSCLLGLLCRFCSSPFKNQRS